MVTPGVVLTLVGAVLTLIGAMLGALGASTLYWYKRSRIKALLEAETPSGSNFGERAENRSKATFALRKRDNLRDTCTLVGWSFVIVGATFAIAGQICTIAD